MEPKDDFYRDLLDSLAEGVYFVDKDRYVTYWNHGAEAIAGFTRDEVVGTQCSDGKLNHVDDTGKQLCDEEDCPLWRCMQTGENVVADVFLHHRSGHRVPVRAKTAPIRDNKGNIVGAVEAFEDRSSHFDVENRLKVLESLALVDPLTGIGNRRLGEERLNALMGQLGRYEWPFGVLFIDIDNFKDLNDAYGHNVGDAVLRAVGQTLRTNVRSHDDVARWGGEEFVVFLVNVDNNSLSAIAEKMRALVEQSGVKHHDEELHVTVSIGATLCGLEDTQESLLARADQLMYQSKRMGRNCVTLD